MLQKRSQNVLIPQIIFILLLIILIQSNEPPNPKLSQQQCQCLKKNTCFHDNISNRCLCKQGYIGDKCQQQALQITQNQIYSEITKSYKYFYFQPGEMNYYQMNLKICIPKGEIIQKTFTNLIFLEVQRTSGKLKLEPNIYQTSPMTFQGQRKLNQKGLNNLQKQQFDLNNNKIENCHTFSTHYIPIRKKINNQYQKIIFGISIKNNSDMVATKWVNFLQNNIKQLRSPSSLQLSSQQFSQFSQNNHNQQLSSLNISISCTYQLYLVQNYYSTAIIILSTIILIISVMAFVYTIKNKFTFFGEFDENFIWIYLVTYDFYNVHNRNNNLTRLKNQQKNDLQHFDTLMPQIKYGKFMNKQIRKNINVNKNKNSKKLIEESQHESQHHDEYSQTTIQEINPQQQKQFQSFSNQQISSVLLQPLQQLPYSQFFSNIQNLQKSCIICLLQFEQNQNIRITPCQHIFHSECIDNWCENTLNCPVCRRGLDEKVIIIKIEIIDWTIIIEGIYKNKEGKESKIII